MFNAPCAYINSSVVLLAKAFAGISATLSGSVSPITALNAPLSNPVTVTPFIVSGTYKSDILPIYWVIMPLLFITKFSSLSIY